MKLYLDDVRETPEGFDARAYTAQEAIAYLETGKVSLISFDHDLGAPENGTGYDVAKWIEEQAHMNSSFFVPFYIIHSANPVGRENILNAMKSAVRVGTRDTKLLSSV